MTRDAFAAMLQNNALVCIAFQARNASNLPPHLRSLGRIVLAVSTRSTHAEWVKDLALTPYGVTATLSFAREWWRVFVPWAAVLSAHTQPNDATIVGRDEKPRGAKVYDLDAYRARARSKHTRLPCAVCRSQGLDVHEARNVCDCCSEVECP